MNFSGWVWCFVFIDSYFTTPNFHFFFCNGKELDTNRKKEFMRTSKGRDYLLDGGSTQGKSYGCVFGWPPDLAQNLLSAGAHINPCDCVLGQIKVI